jgi:hypothetical protein
VCFVSIFGTKNNVIFVATGVINGLWFFKKEDLLRVTKVIRWFVFAINCIYLVCFYYSLKTDRLGITDVDQIVAVAAAEAQEICSKDAQTDEKQQQQQPGLLFFIFCTTYF